MSRSVILASAGTGKTWQLTTRLIELLAGGAAPRSVLASTFTRKAAGEIADRVFQRLAAAATDESERAALQAATGLELDAAAWRGLCARLARGVHELSILTLDAFFLRLLQSAGPDLGLPPAWRISDDHEDAKVREEAVLAVIADADGGELAALLHDLQKGAPRNAVVDVLRRAVEDVHPVFVDCVEGAWGKIQAPKPPPDERLARARAVLEGFECPQTKAGAPNKGWRKALDAVLPLVAAGEWVAVIESGLAKGVLEKGEYYKIEIDEDLRDAFEVFACAAAHEVGRLLAARNRATERLLADFDARYGEACRARGRFRFDGLPGFLLGEDADPGARRTAGLVHVLLDEFQDTDPRQWRVLRRLFQGPLEGADGTSLLVVGDPKQSIYGFRLAEPELLASLPDDLGVEATPLDENRRSSPVVLRAVDRVFEKVAESRAWDKHSERRRAAQDFAARFRSHRPHYEDMPGRFELLAAPAAERDARVRVRLDLAARRAADLAKRHPGASVAILLRNNKQIPSLLYRLQREAVRASGEGGNPLTDSAAVNVALSALQLADHPSDSAAHFHVATSGLAEALGLAFERGGDKDARRRSNRELAGAWSADLRRDLVERGLPLVLEGWRPAVAEAYGGWDQGRFDQLIELAAAVDGEPPARATDFVRRVKAERVEDPRGANVQVMTVHASKGLEFDAVILPELDEPFVRQAPEPLVRRGGDGRSGPFEVASRNLSEKKRALIGEVADLHAVAALREVGEELCVLYVGMTRARRWLELICDHWDKDGQPHALAGLVRDAFVRMGEPGEELDGGATLLFADGDDGALEDLPGSDPDAPAEPPAPGRIELAPSDGSADPTRLAPSRLAGAERLTARELLAPPGAALARGLRVHAWLERVEWLPEVPSDAELVARARELGLDAPELQQDLADLRAALERAQIRDLLVPDATLARLGAGHAELRVLTEERFAFLDSATNSLVSGALDRAVVAERDGRPVAAEVIDWKTDAVASGDAGPLFEAPAVHVEHYRPQLEAYRRALCARTGLAPERVAARLAFVVSGQVVSL